MLSARTDSLCEPEVHNLDFAWRQEQLDDKGETILDEKTREPVRVITIDPRRQFW